ncbi:hypothetical protein DC522_24720 [Microvirga sp. KLBC 81]|uniref:hypothetical protein n=1 Tax=Microvirga sp. KLBC 81 TaxID=1862707 RepID=UPI000D51E19F|nr:hypothetical protein [Microvirga sp. KLBC 81]PVE21771.1 hypothetical protein DC522_24720 [Microvirga sp. KLBC 81]
MTAWQHRERGPITEEKLLRAVNILADIVEQHGPAHRPLYQDVKRELAEFRRRQQESNAAAEPAFATQIGRVA